MVELAISTREDEELLRTLVREHEEKTTSPRARTILVQWEEYPPLFRKVVPKGAEELVGTIRAHYLGTAQREDPELVPERRTA